MTRRNARRDIRRDARGSDEPSTSRGRIARSGDGFLVCSDGRKRWGLFGAAGALFVYRTESGIEALIQLRSTHAHEGGTWSCPGGAIDLGESTLQAALREAAEEVGSPPDGWNLLGEYIFAPADDWQYVTSVIQVTHRFGTAANFETAQVRWCELDRVTQLPLHPGFAAAWPFLHAIAVS